MLWADVNCSITLAALTSSAWQAVATKISQTPPALPLCTSTEYYYLIQPAARYPEEGI
jgi:hypothetical protein